MGLTTFNRMRRQAAIRAAEEATKIKAEKLAGAEAERMAEEEATKREAEEAARLEAERVAAEQQRLEEEAQAEADHHAVEGEVSSEHTLPDEEGLELSFRELRAEAKKLGISGYGKMNQEQLQEAVSAASLVATEG